MRDFTRVMNATARGLLVSLFHRVEPRHDLGERVVPGYRLVPAVAALAGALERLRDPIRVIRDLDCRLAAGAQAAVD